MKKVLILASLVGCCTPAYAQGIAEMAKQAMPITVDRQVFNAVVQYLNTQAIATTYQCGANPSQWFCSATQLRNAMNTELNKAMEAAENAETASDAPAE